MKKQAQSGDNVILHFTGKNEAEEVFATTKGEQPVELTIGEGKVIPGVENGIIGMQIGESRTFEVPPEDAFGERRGELVTTIKKDDFPESIHPSVGQQLRVRVEGDKLTDVRVTRIEANDVTLDANHPLAGQTLKFEVDLVDIK
jgi:FKBP-type peptidyl-prolyl cis-trans isomerase 2